MKGWTKTVGALVLGTLAGVAGSELIFSVRHGGAFPHLNIYRDDKQLGARLLPSSETRLRIADNPATHIRTNGAGYRGPDWPAPGGDEIAVLGDSQAFGLGVEEDATIASQLAKLTRRTVLNLGVPTYGPAEYRAVLEEVGRTRKPRQVVVVVNMANDLFETQRPNRERHAVWDGWAVRKETAPAKVLDFPGRKWLFQRSHAVFELRRFLALRDPETTRITTSTLPSEASFRVFAEASLKAQREHEANAAAAEANERAFRQARASAKERLLAADQAAIERLLDMYGEEATYRAGMAVPDAYEDGWLDATTQLKTARANPGDIVGEIAYGESTGPYVATARAIRNGARFRASLEEMARRRHDASQADLKAKAAIEAVDKTQGVEEELAKLLASAPDRPVTWSPLRGDFERLKTLTEEWGAELILVILPLDVQVDPKEWDKYGDERVPMTDSLLLNDDAVQTARQLGIKVVSPLEELRRAQPGAFLRRDLHLTERGNAVVASTIAQALTAPRALPLPRGGLPPGLRRLPSPERLRVEAVVKGSSAAHCETYLRDGWFRAVCSAAQDGPLEGIVWQGDASRLGSAYRLGNKVSLVLGVQEGQRHQATLIWEKGARVLSIDASQSAPEPVIELGALAAQAEATLPVQEVREDSEACRCAKLTFESRQRTSSKGALGTSDTNATFACGDELLSFSSDCEQAYRGRCDELLACLNGDPWYAPACAPGFAHGGPLERCLAQCDDDIPCAPGSSCQPWQGAKLCFAQ